MSFSFMLRVALCTILAGRCGGMLAWAAEGPDLKAQAEAGLKTLAAAEFALYSYRGHYASEDELLEADRGNICKGVAPLLEANPDTGVYYSVAASRDGQHFFGVATYGREFAALCINETGVLSELPKYASAQQLIEKQRMENFLTAKAQWAMEADSILKQHLHQVQLAVERWSTDRSAGAQDEYPETLEPVVSEGYIAAGFYPNPVTAWSIDEYNARSVPLGQWSPGDFSYVPQLKDDRCIGYMLVGYGCNRTGGHDYNGDGAGDGYAIVLASGTDDSGWYTRMLEQGK